MTTLNEILDVLYEARKKKSIVDHLRKFVENKPHPSQKTTLKFADGKMQINGFQAQGALLVIDHMNKTGNKDKMERMTKQLETKWKFLSISNLGMESGKFKIGKK